MKAEQARDIAKAIGSVHEIIKTASLQGKFVAHLNPDTPVDVQNALKADGYRLKLESGYKAGPDLIKVEW